MKRLSLLLFLLACRFGFAAESDLSGPGVNLGNMLEAPHEGAWGVTFQDEYPGLIKKAGFAFVRIPVCWSAHVGPAPDSIIDPAFLARVDHVLAQVKASGLQAILDYHNDDALMHDPDANADRFVAIWKQLATHYAHEPVSVSFELLNEPNGKLDDAHWNALLVRTLSTVRATNPDRTVVVGPVHWNSISALDNLVLPDADRHLLVTVHFYDPMTFTHQGASWIPGSDKWEGNTWLGTDREKQAVTQAFDKAAAWGTSHQRPMFLGEFGSFSHGDMDSRARWTACVARAAESHGFVWSYWEFCAGFGLYDPFSDQWREPLLHALIPPADGSK
jgi:endoglucanase